MSNSRDIADSAATINFIDTVTSNVQDQIDNVDSLPTQSGQTGKFLTTNGSAASWATLVTDPTLGTLTQTFTNGQVSTISLTSSVLAPVVTVTKEVAQTGSTNNTWDVNSTSQNYTRLDSAPATTLDFPTDLSTASFVDAFSVTAQEADPRGVAFNTDGTKMFVCGSGGQDVNEYTLSTGFDVSTSTFVDAFSVSAQDSIPMDLAFNTDGTKMFVVGLIGQDVNEYTLSTGFDVSTSTFVDAFSVSSQDTSPNGLAFNADGTKMFVVGETADAVYEYTLSTGFDVSTSTYSQSFSVSAQETSPQGLAFNTGGTKMFVVGKIGDDVNEYALSTGFDVSTAAFTQSFSVSAQTGWPHGIAFNTDQTKMFIVGLSADEVNEYDISRTALALGTGSFVSADVGKTIEANSGAFVLTATTGTYVESTAPTSYAQVASGSWSMYGVVYNTTDGDLELSNYNPVWNVSGSVFVDNYDVSAQDTTPTGIAFNPDGTKMYVVGGAGADVMQYTLTTGFDVSTASYSFLRIYVGSEETQPRGIAFNADGTKMFLAGLDGIDVNEYTLSTGFNVSTASFVDSFSVSAQDSTPYGIAFNADGTKMFVVGQQNDKVYEYVLSTGFDVSTASFTDGFSVASQDPIPHGISFSTDGTTMFVVGRTSPASVYQYTLSTGFDVSTASYASISFNVSSQEIYPFGMAFNSEGTKFFIVGNDGDEVNEYSVGSFVSTSGYQPVHTTTSTDTQYWTDINSMTASQAAGDGNVYYAISTDDRTTWSVIKDVGGERDIVRNNSGTWQYNSNGTYASET